MTKDIHKPRIAFFLAVLLVINCFWNTGILQTRAEELDPETLESRQKRRYRQKVWQLPVKKRLKLHIRLL